MRVTVRLSAARAAAAPPRSSACAIVVDVLRATTTLSVARANGAARIVPVATPEAAFEARRRMPEALVCGEREGRIVPGFDLGNSPLEYTPERVAGRTLIFASTNGSLAMLAARSVRRILLGAFVNASAVLEAVRGEPHVAIICAGKLGGFALEDAACAGFLCARLAEREARLAGPEAAFAVALAPGDARETRALVQGASHGRYLRALGPAFAEDLEFCAAVDSLDRACEI